MLYIGGLSEEEIVCFNELQRRYPDRIFIRTEHGFDMSSTVQVVIDLSDILQAAVPSIISAVEILLTYRIQKKQTELMAKEAELHRKELELEQKKEPEPEFEMRISSNGETDIIVKTDDVERLLKEPDRLKAFMEQISEQLRTIE